MAAMYGINVDEDRLVAGEFILGMRAPEKFAGLPSGLVFVQGDMPNLGRSIPLAVPPTELERIKDELRALPDHQEGMFGPRGSVLVFGVWKTRGTWPLRIPSIEVQEWIALGNKNSLTKMAKEAYHALKLGIKISHDIASVIGR
jgi:hypothetical protein